MSQTDPRCKPAWPSGTPGPCGTPFMEDAIDMFCRYNVAPLQSNSPFYGKVDECKAALTKACPTFTPGDYNALFGFTGQFQRLENGKPTAWPALSNQYAKALGQPAGDFDRLTKAQQMDFIKPVYWSSQMQNYGSSWSGGPTNGCDDSQLACAIFPGYCDPSSRRR